MKKFIIILVILLTLSSALMADTGTSVLSLLIPGDTLTLKLVSSCTVTTTSTTTSTNTSTTTISDIKELSGDYKLFTLNKYSQFNASQFNKSSTTKDAVYATSAVTFYVIYHALVSKTSKIVITVPEKFYSTDGSDSLPVQSDTDKIEAGGATVLVPKDNTIVTLNSTQVYNGAVKCILALDITNAKKGVTYSGTITMKVDAV